MFELEEMDWGFLTQPSVTLWDWAFNATSFFLAIYQGGPDSVSCSLGKTNKCFLENLVIGDDEAAFFMDCKVNSQNVREYAPMNNPPP